MKGRKSRKALYSCTLLERGAQLGPYAIDSPLGAGGMGEVYRATDTRLKRSVAIKILPAAVALDADRVARFQREAELLASLNHPNIAAIYGLERTGETTALVMELVEGPTLADRIQTGPIPIDEALTLARQMAEALDAAHEQGVIHRDLKPANIKLRSDGTVKVLDFGLAKAMEPAGAMSPGRSMSPTLTTPAMTQAGMILGTAAYMSPEQARGKAVDRRADVWAFGCVLYEMVTGKQAFAGEDVTEVLAAIVRGEPDWRALPEDLPTAVRTLLVRCLQKDLKKRIRSAGDIAIEVEDALDRSIPVRHAPRVAPAARLRSTVIAVGCLLLGLLIGALATRVGRTAPAVAVGRFTLTLPAGQRLAGLSQRAISLSPDGTRLAYIARAGGSDQIYVRDLDSFASRALPGTEGATNPFFSPDGQWIGFFTEDALKKIAVGGGPLTTLARVAEYSRGGTWGGDGNIVFASGPTSGLSLVPAAGGTVQSLTKMDGGNGETSHRHPHHVPGGALLFTVGTGGGWDNARIEVLDPGTHVRKTLIQGGSDAHYVSTGHLVYLRAATLVAVPFDVRRLEVTGSEVALVEGVLPPTDNTGSAQATFADSGALIYVPGNAAGLQRLPVWVDRKGAEQLLQVPARPYDNPSVSPDSTRVLLSIDAGNFQDVWVHDVRRGTLNKVTSDGAGNGAAMWTADGKKIIYQVTKTDVLNLAWKLSDGSGGDEVLGASTNSQFPDSLSVDGQTLTVTEIDPATGRDLWALSLKDRQRKKFLQTAAHESNSAISPDGRWIAYQSDRSGRDEIYVQPFPGPGSEELVSTDGGTAVRWSRNGRELYYRSGDKLMAVAIETAAAFHASKPELLFEKPYWSRRFYPSYDVASDGRFLMIKDSDQVGAANVMNVVLHWTEELKRRVPVR